MFATDSMRSSVASLKKKLSNLKISIEQFDSELDKLETKFDKLLTQTDIYKSKLEREKGREAKRLETELNKLRKQLSSLTLSPDTIADSNDLKIASTIGIFECILRHICESSDDFKLMSYAFLFPAVFERVMASDDPAYLIDSLPAATSIVIERGRSYVEHIRSQCDTHVTDPEAWENYIDEVTNWWKNDALPLLYGSRDEQWEADSPLSLLEMLTWRDEPSERPLNFSPVFDAYEIYRANKDAIYDSSGIRSLDLKMFSFASN